MGHKNDRMLLPVIKAFYTRLREVGKPEKVARCAAARKLLHIAWAVVKKDQPFDPNEYRIFACVLLLCTIAYLFWTPCITLFFMYV